MAATARSVLQSFISSGEASGPTNVRFFTVTKDDVMAIEPRASAISSVSAQAEPERKKSGEKNIPYKGQRHR